MMRRVLAGAVLAALCLPAAAQDRFADAGVAVAELAPGLHMLRGVGGNVALVTGDGPSFIVDDDFAQMAGKLEAAVATVSDEPVGFVINTHWHGDHTGGNRHFAGAGAVIVAHDNVRKRMSTDQFTEVFGRTTPASPAAALPVVTFGDSLTLHLNGKTMDVLHLPAAHTDGDAVVFFREDNALHTGDLFFFGLYPFIDIDAGGGIRGMVAALTRLLEMTDETTKIIPGHGPLAGRDDMRAFRDFLTTMADAIEGMIADGMSREEILAAKPTADYDAVFNREGFFQPDQWVSLLYADLSR